MKQTTWILFILLALVYFVGYCWNITDYPITRWDESRLAINALEMMQSGNYGETTFMSEPDLWNTKPPLLIIFQSISFQLFGVSEFSFRLPTLIAVLLLVLVIIRFAKQRFDSIEMGLFASLILLCTPGFCQIHVGLTGDYDALLIFFVTLTTLSVLLYLHNNRLSELVWIAAGLSGALLTKGIAGGILLFALFVALISLYPIKKALDKKLIGVVFVGLLLPIGYYVYRFHVSPEYITAVIANEWSGRYGGAIEGHQHPFYYYFQLLVTKYMGAWLGVGALLYFFKRVTLHKEVKTLLLTSLLFVFIISLAGTKLPWYLAQVYPFLALVIAYILKELYLQYRFVVPTFLLVVSVHFSYLVYQNSHLEQKIGGYKDYRITSCLQKEFIPLQELTVLEKGYYPQNLFYVLKWKHEGVDISYVSDVKQIKHHRVLVWQPEIIRKLKRDFVVEKEEECGGGYLITLKRD